MQPSLLSTDLFAVDHSCGHRPASDAAAVTEAAMTVCGSGFVLVLDRAGQVLARTWCLYECATALRRYGQNRFRMAAPSECCSPRPEGRVVRGRTGLYREALLLQEGGRGRVAAPSQCSSERRAGRRAEDDETGESCRLSFSLSLEPRGSYPLRTQWSALQLGCGGGTILLCRLCSNGCRGRSPCQRSRVATLLTIYELFNSSPTLQPASGSTAWRLSL